MGLFKETESALFGMPIDDFLVFGVEWAGIPLAEPAPFRVVFFEEVDWALVSHLGACVIASLGSL
jgi:hypothetical protein